MASHFKVIDDLRIAYQVENENAPETIFFFHGNSGSSRVWRKQMGSELLAAYRLIALDLPGHGNSGHSSNPDDDYGPIGTAAIMSRCVRELSGDAPYILAGLSYGTNLASEMLQFELSPAGIFLSGSCVFGGDYGLDRVFSPTETPSIFLYNEPARDKASEFIRQDIQDADEPDLMAAIEDYLNVSPEFKPALFKAVGEGKCTDEMANLKQSGIPVAIVFGERDTLVQIHYLDEMPFPAWRNQVLIIPGAGHWANMEKPAIFDRHLADYANEMFKATRT